MVVFLAGRRHIQLRQLHRRIANRFQTDDRFGTVQFRIADAREPGPYRVDVETNPRLLLDTDAYPVTDARLEIGFDFRDQGAYEYYWVNWIEPDRHFLLGWHRDDDHPELGQVHLQVTQYETTVERVPAAVIDEHPMAVLEARLTQLPATLARVEWDDGSVVGL